jgi:hypothetical protein
MKRIFGLALLLAAVPVSAQNIVLGVLETGDYTIAVDTVEFFWGTIAPALFTPEGFGGPPLTTDSSEFELLPAGLPPNVRVDWLRNGARMPCESIIGLVPDFWYDLSGFDAPTRIKFLPQPGISESRSTPYAGPATPTIVRGLLFVSREPSAVSHQPALLFDAAGRNVMCVWPGANDVRGLAPGGYFLRSSSGVMRHASSATRLVILH